MNSAFAFSKSKELLTILAPRLCRDEGRNGRKARSDRSFAISMDCLYISKKLLECLLVFSASCPHRYHCRTLPSLRRTTTPQTLRTPAPPTSTLSHPSPTKLRPSPPPRQSTTWRGCRRRGRVGAGAGEGGSRRGEGVATRDRMLPIG